MNKLSIERRAQILAMLTEGNSMRATARMAGCSFNTVSKLLLDVGSACTKFQDDTLRNLHCTEMQCDEIWSFVGSKAKNVPDDRRDEFGVGDVWPTTSRGPTGRSPARIRAPRRWQPGSRITSGRCGRSRPCWTK